MPLNAVQTQPMPPETAVILTTHPIEDQIPHNPMLQQIIEQQEIIKSLQDQLSAQHEEMSTLKVNVRSLTDAFNERINQKVAEGTSTLWEKVEKLEEDIPSINSKITRLINNSISIEGASSVIDKLLIKFGENTVQILNTQMTKIERTLQQKLSTIEDKMLKTNGKAEGLKKNEGTHSEKKFGDQENSILTVKTQVDLGGAQLSRKLTKTDQPPATSCNDPKCDHVRNDAMIFCPVYRSSLKVASNKAPGSDQNFP